MGTMFALGIKAILATFVAMFTSFKTLLVVTLVAVLGVALYNVAVILIENILGWVMAEVAAVPVGELPNTVLQLTGFGAWMAQQVYLDTQIGIAVTAISLKWLVMKIPFLKW